jgi:hypothetical protein
MTEPKRWLDDPQLPSRLREVLCAGSTVPPVPVAVNRRLSQFAIGLAAQGAALPAAAAGSILKTAATALGATSVGKALVLASIMGALGTGSYAVTRWRIQASSPAPNAESALSTNVERHAVTNASTSPHPLAEPRVPSSIGPAELPVVDTQAGPARSGATTRESAASSAPVRPVSSEPRAPAATFDELGLADEARLLEQARAVLPSNPAGALQITSDHGRLYPSGQLSAECDLIAVDALLRLGRRQEAEQKAAVRLQGAPGGLYARRLHQLLAR